MKHWILAAATLLLMNNAHAEIAKWTPPGSRSYNCEKKCPKPVSRESRKQECGKPACVKQADPCCPPVCFERALPTEVTCTPSAFSESANLELRNSQNLRFSVSYLYWQAMQGGMDLAVPAQALSNPIPDGSSIQASPSGNSVLTQDFSFDSGFKIGAGWFGAKDEWVVYGEYTRLHGNSQTSANAIAPSVASVGGVAVPPLGVWTPTSWFPLNSYTNGSAASISSNWQYNVDLVDLQLSRPFYSGTRFTLEPFVGFRTALIDQTMSIDAINIPTVSVGFPAPVRNANYASDSWGVGPRAGMNGNWLMGSGVRFIGNAAASLLYTRYTKVTGKVDSPDTGTVTSLPVNVRMHSVNTLRPNMDLSMGLGWGSYFKCRRIFWDLSATYDFNIFWEQNMMRSLADLTNTGSDGAASNLYLHGLTLRTQINF